MAKGIDLSAFYREEVEPQLWEYIGEIFSDFKLRGRTWISPFKLDGVTASHEGRKDKTYIGNPQGRAYTHIRVAEQGGESIDLLELIERRKGLDFAEAVKYAAGIVGREVPQGTSYDQEKAQKHKEKQQRLEAILSQMKAALFSPEGEAVLRYLKEGRGYSEEYIKAQPFGYIDIQMECFSELRRLLSYYSTAEQKDKYPYYSKQKGIGVGITNKFAIAYVADGEIKGFAFRSILSAQELQEKGASKYYSAYIGEKETQAYFPTATPSGKLTAYSDKYLNFTIVEGELDTYRGLYAGLKNVVGLSQGSLTAEQLQRLKKKGAESITLLLDTEALQEGTADPEKSRRGNREKAAKAVNLIATQGLSPYVLYLPSEHGEKVDIDEYFKGLEGDELQAKGAQLQEQIDSAEGGFTFLFSLLAEQYSSTGQNLRDLRKFLKNTLILTQREECDLIEQKVIYERFAEATGHTITAEDIEDSLSDTDQEEMLRNAQNALQAQISKASEQFHTDPEKTLQELKAAVSEYETASAGGETALREKYRTIETAEKKEERRSGKKRGILTGYTFKAKKSSEEEPLMLPSGALTYVCLPTSHGKTRLLENLALQLALNKKEEGSVLFFSVEEDADAVEDELLNIFHTLRNYREPQAVGSKETFIGECRKKQLSGNSLRTIRSYYAETDQEKKGNYFRGALYSEEHRQLYENFKQSRRSFYSQLIESEKLKVFYEESRNVDRIIEGIKFLWKDLQTDTQQRPIKAVFIDYVQRLRKTGDFRGNRKEELTAVTNSLMSLSIELGVPFVIAVQLNREALSPLEMDLQNIADAAEIEQSGNLVLLGWNSSFNARAKSSAWYYKEKKARLLTDEANAFTTDTGISLGTPGDLYLVTAKNRAGQRNFESRLYFDGNSGLILQGERPMDSHSRVENAKANVGTQPQPTLQEKRTEQERATQAALNTLYGKQQEAEPTQPTPEDDPLGDAPEDGEAPF